MTKAELIDRLFAITLFSVLIVSALLPMRLSFVSASTNYKQIHTVPIGIADQPHSEPDREKPRVLNELK